MGIKAKVLSAVAKSKFWYGGHKMEVNLVIGAAATIGCVVTACIATKKANDLIQDAKMDIEDIQSDGVAEFVEYQNARREAEGLEPIKVDTLDEERAIKQIKRRTAIKVGKLYIAPFALLVISEASRVKGYVDAKKEITRLGGLLIAATAENKMLRRYRARTFHKFGEEIDRELMYGENCEDAPMEEVTKVNPETGEEYTVLEPNREKCLPWPSIYAVEYVNQSYQPNLDVDKVRYVQNWANDRLVTRGYVFLNEVYEALGLPSNGNFVGVGWISRQYIKSGYLGDGFIDFGVFKEKIAERTLGATEWINNEKNSVTLDFNVDGPIYTYVNSINKLNEKDRDLWIADRAAYYRGRPEPYHV